MIISGVNMMRKFSGNDRIIQNTLIETRYENHNICVMYDDRMIKHKMGNTIQYLY